MDVAGVDWARDRWVAVLLRGSAFLDATAARSLEALVAGPLEGCVVITVDTPIGLPQNGGRPADVEARRFVGPRRSSVFATPPRWALEAVDYATARALASAAGGAGISAQAYALRRQILEVSAKADADPRIHEVHPEVSFCAMRGHALPLPKRTWGGFALRRALLSSQGISIPDELPGAERCGIDDVLDAAAGAWTARRIARGAAGWFPAQAAADRVGRIWY